MKTLGFMSLSEQSPSFYLKKAFELIRNSQTTDAIQCIDTAIIFSHHAPFYIFQKIKLLYYWGNQTICSQFILSQLSHLYKNGSLYIFCRTLGYLQKINHYNTAALKIYLDQQHIPYCLADCYPLILRRKYKTLYKMAHKAMMQDNYPLCIDYLHICLKCTCTYNESTDIYYKLAYSYHMLGRLLDAKKYYELYFELQPYAADAYTNLGFITMELGDLTSAIHYFKKACLMVPSHPDYPLYLGECLYLAKKYSEAVNTYKAFSKEHPDNLQVYFNLSHTYKKMAKTNLSKHYTKFVNKQLKKHKR